MTDFVVKVPNIAVESLVGHAAYGLVLGVVYAVLE